MLFVLATLVFALAGSWLFYRAFRGADGVRAGTAIKLAIAGAILAFPARLLNSYVLDSLGWSLQISSTVSLMKAWLASVVVVAALSHLVFVVVVSPIYRGHRLERLGTALSAAGLAAAGYGTVHAVMGVAFSPNVESLLTGLGGLSLSVCTAGIWASCLSTSHARYRPLSLLAWLLAVLLEGTIRHLLVARVGLWQWGSLPLLVATVTAVLFSSRKLQGPRQSVMFTQAYRLGLHVDVEGVRAAFQHTHRPALIHWIVGGALVSFGASLVALAIGVVVAHWLSIDLSRVDETNKNAMAPLLLLGGCVLLSFAVAGFITAKASAADSLFEPGMAALISILALTLLLARSAPVTLVLGLAFAPVAFALSCVGAWLGQERKR